MSDVANVMVSVILNGMVSGMVNSLANDVVNDMHSSKPASLNRPIYTTSFHVERKARS